MAPKQVDRLDDGIYKVLVNSLATRFSVEPKVARKFLPMDVKQWGKLLYAILKVAISCTCMRLFLNTWMAEMHLLFVIVNYCQIFLVKLIYLSLFPNSISNLLTETSAIKTFLKSSSFKHFSGNFCTSSSFPFPKAQKLKQKSIKMFVLKLFDKFIPTLKRCCQFHCIQ